VKLHKPMEKVQSNVKQYQVLFSLNKALEKGFKVINDGVVISFHYKHVKLTDDHMIHPTDCCVAIVKE
jgi:hypothetical protein